MSAGERCEMPDHNPLDFEPGDHTLGDRLCCHPCMMRATEAELAAGWDPRSGLGIHQDQGLPELVIPAGTHSPVGKRPAGAVGTDR